MWWVTLFWFLTAYGIRRHRPKVDFSQPGRVNLPSYNASLLCRYAFSGSSEGFGLGRGRSLSSPTPVGGIRLRKMVGQLSPCPFDWKALHQTPNITAAS